MQILIFEHHDYDEILSNLPPSLKVLNIVIGDYYFYVADAFYEEEKQRMELIKNNAKIPFDCVFNIFYNWHC